MICKNCNYELKIEEIVNSAGFCPRCGSDKLKF